MCWCGHLSGAKCRLFGYGPVDATASPSSLASFNSRLVLPFWYELTQVVLEKRPLSWCSAVVVLRSGYINYMYVGLSVREQFLPWNHQIC